MSAFEPSTFFIALFIVIFFFVAIYYLFRLLTVVAAIFDGVNALPSADTSALLAALRGVRLLAMIRFTPDDIVLVVIVK